ncbi:MAG: hypothetical protein KDA24_14485 [Deltaproteobacteria bacterium]|nr:hypothetical protein [Deltaproteobacteria bacterium]
MFILDGDLIAGNAEEDNARLELMLLADGHVEYPVLDVVRDSVRMGGDLGDLLVRGGHIDGATLMAARKRLFRDAFVWVVASEDPQMIWDPRDAIFPDNMQFGVNLNDLLSEATSWLNSNRHTLSLLASGDYFVAHGRRPREINDAAWAAISVPHAGKALVEAIGAPSREEAVEALTALFARGVMTIARDSEGREPRTDPVVHDEPDTENVDREEVIASNTAEGMDIALRLGGDANDDAPDVEVAGLPPVQDVAEDTEESLDDYERARRGDFIKSYEVLDKVDLSGVAVLGAGSPESFGDLPAIEMGDEDDDEDMEDLSDPDLEVMLDALDQDFPDPSPTATQLKPLKELDTAELMEPQEDDFALFGDSDLPEVQPQELLADPGPQPDPSDSTPSFVLPAHVTGPFPHEELSEYYGKISTFNSIFRIIYGTFSEHIGSDNARQRFNALLSSNQRQYPELFKSILVLDDGCVEPAPIIANLAACTDNDHGSLLHQGLYELIFSHLYDAKDMLPGDVESEMMERILVHERQLHPA